MTQTMATKKTRRIEAKQKEDQGNFHFRSAQWHKCGKDDFQGLGKKMAI